MSKAMSNEFQIRKAKREDMQEVIKLIEELADFEKMKNEVKINAKVLENDAFDLDHPRFQCLVAENVNLSELVGYAIFYDTYSTWLGQALFLEDLYVRPKQRSKQIGKSLFVAVAKHAYENCSRLDFEVLSWNPAMEFYKNFGAINLTKTESWQRMRLDKEALRKIVE